MRQENPLNPPLRASGFRSVRAWVLFGLMLVISGSLWFLPHALQPQPNTAPAPIARAQPTLEKATFTITRKDGKALPFTVELARTGQEMEMGLMYRTHMEANEGMLFLFPDESPHAMWMKNTLLPLDMLFIDAWGTITSIAARAMPESETVIDSGGPISSVLELRGGTAEAYGIAAGDKTSLASPSGAP